MKENRPLGIIVILSLLTFCSCCQQQKQHELVGVWNLESVSFEKADTTITQKFDEILMFSKDYYSNIQSAVDDTQRNINHAGTYSVSNDTIFVQIKYSGKPSDMGWELDFTFQILRDTLTIYILPQKGIKFKSSWIYTRLE